MIDEQETKNMESFMRELSGCESLIMKTVWDVKEDIAVQDLIRELAVRYNKNYARTTVVTFLPKMAEKGYVSTYRKGKASFVHAEKSEEEYTADLLRKQTDFWFSGKPSKLVASLCETQELSLEEISKIKELIENVE